MRGLGGAKKSIYLTGFMGCGKSTIGLLLAQKLARNFVDTDILIMAKTGLTIAEIFSKLGEPQFRELEKNSLASLRLQKNLVVSSGGGAILSETNRNILNTGHWVFLDVPFAILKERILSDPKRPLAQNGEDALFQLWQARRPFYEKAHFKIRCETLTPDAICQKILKTLKSKQ
jgi:shikimate kinase